MATFCLNSKKHHTGTTLCGVFIIVVIFLTMPAFPEDKFILPNRLGPKNFDYKIINAFVNSGDKGILTAFKGDPEMRGTHLQLSYYLKAGESFKAEFLIGNYTDQVVDYFILCLMDYKQQEFVFNGKRATSHPVSIKPGERVIYAVTLDNIEKGAHDFLLIAVKTLRDSDNPAEADFPLLFHRANIFVESYSFPRISYNEFYQKPSDFQVFKIVINKSQEVNHFEELYYDTKSSSDKLQFYIHINNSYSDDALHFAIVPFDDTKQISFRQLDENVLYYYLKSKTKSVIKVNADLKYQKGSLWAINIDNPYSRLETEDGRMAQIPTIVRISNTIKFR